MHRVLLCLGLAIGMVGMFGCTPPVDPVLDLLDTDLQKTKVDDLSRTMDFVFSERRFDQQEFESKVSTGLNRWVTYATDKTAPVQWKLDSAVEPLIKKYDDLAIVERTDEMSFVDADAYYLQESCWVDQVVKRSTNSKQLNAFELYRLAADDFKPSDESQDPVVEVVQKLHDGLDGESSQKLADVLKYFDWIVRNVQLLPAVDHGDDDLDELRLNDKEGLAAAGVAGLGYQRYPWQTLMFARGDYVDRAKLFMVGAKHLGLDAVMFAVKSSGQDELQPWVVGVLIGEEYYLFDTRLGLPLPGEKLGSIATLSAVRANPDLISGLDLTVKESLEDDTKYWIEPKQLKDLVGLIYATPESVARRMAVLEYRLIGDERLPLTSFPGEMEQRLKKTAASKSNNVEFQVWDIGFKTHQFRQAVREALKDTGNNVLVNRLRWYYEDEAYIDGFPRYRTSRARFFVGKFESERNSVGLNAIESFEHLIYSDESIDSLATDAPLQRALGIRAAGEDGNVSAVDFNTQLRNVQEQMRMVRRDTKYFLAQSHFDNGSVKAAANWLKLLQSESEAERWKDGVNYLLGRAIEAGKEYDEAIKQYYVDPKSPQAHGNLIRARMLTQLVKRLMAEPEPE